jgi:signal peptidase I
VAAAEADETVETAETVKAGSRGRRVAVDLALLVVAILVITTVLRALVGQAFYVENISMSPQLEDQDRIVVSKLSYRLHDARRGDVVVLDAPPSRSVPEPAKPLASRAVRAVLEGVNVVRPTTTEYVKRVIGLPGERVSARGGNVYVDDRLLVEPYLPEGARTGDFEPVAVPAGKLFVMGDNRGSSDDSRRESFGPIEKSSVVGRVVVRVWPLGSACWL